MENYLKIPEAIWGLNIDKKIEMFLMADIYNLSKVGYYKTDKCFAEQFCTSKSTVIRARKNLLEKGYIVKEWDQKFRRHVYRACVDKEAPTQEQEPVPVRSNLNDDPFLTD